MKREAVIVSAVRTPVGRCRGALAAVGAPDLGALVIAEAVRRAGLQGEEVEEVIFGNLGNNDNANLARVVTLQAGLPFTVPAITIDRQCSSGLNAIAMGALMIEAGEADILVAGGTESDSNRPHLMEKARVAYQVAPPQWLVRRTAPGALNVSMGTTAENLGRKYHITREECDAFALESHRKAAAAQAAGRFDAQMIPVTVPGKRGKTTVVDRDECVRPESTMETLGRLPTAFEPDGVCTAGNSSPMSDGAGAVVLMDRETAEKKGLEPLAVFRGFAVTGCDPSIMGIGPVEAIRKVLRKTGLTLEEMDLIELNEAFATQSIACIRELGLDMDKVNVNGGALALGHPLAGTGAILTAKLLYELKRRRARYGLVAFCMAGGQGGAAVFERI
ncbi:MAG: thiolase family protein [Flavonifractor plautii]|nr:thiolase family protein [Flavonifractor plautii]MDY3701915.1 thiolase family protein [Flavonifractor plautii]